MSFVPCPVDHVICPYNKSHVIRRERMQFHLTKCLPQPGHKPFVVCPFNSTHLIPAPEINNHKTSCPDRIKLDKFLYEVTSSKPLFEVNKVEIQSEENWDDGVEHTYDPAKVLSERKLLVLKQVAPPSERKKFNAEQRRKFQTLPDEEFISVSKSNKEKAVRLPKTKAYTQNTQNEINESEDIKVVEKAQVVKKEEKMAPIVNKMETITIAEKKPSDEFELVVGKKKNKKGAIQKEASKIKAEPKVKKQPVLNEKNTNLMVSQEEKPITTSEENVSIKPKTDEFIVVTNKKNKKRNK